MNSPDPIPLPPPSSDAPNAAGIDPANDCGGPWRLVAWAGLLTILSVEIVFPVFVVICVLVADRFGWDFGSATLWIPAVAAALFAFTVGRAGWRRYRATDRFLWWGWGFGGGVVPAVILFWIFPSMAKVSAKSQDRAVLGNARQLAAAADQYYLENGVSYATFRDLVGEQKYMRTVSLVAEETYPVRFTQGVTITVRGVAGARTVTYAP
jgi:type IV pilus assembly protein PilA